MAAPPPPPGLVHPGNYDSVTVDGSYLNALVRRANLHDSPPVDPASITISRIEYDNLLRVSRDYQALRNALIMGGAEMSTLDILVNSSNDSNDVRKDSVMADDKCHDEKTNMYEPRMNVMRSEAQVKLTSPSSPPSNGKYRNFSNGKPRPHDTTPWRRVSYAASTPDDGMFDDESDDDANGGVTARRAFGQLPNGQPQRTLYFSGLAESTSYADLISVIKGGKIVSMVIRSKSAMVTFLDGAADFLAWTKRNDIYLQGKRIEVKWADRQFRIHEYIFDKVTHGVTRNILVRNAVHKGLDERRIREDMEHISNLVIIDIRYRDGNAYVYTNSVGHAMTARACMVSRAMYKGCGVKYFEDECDVALPQQRVITPFAPPAVPGKQHKFQKPMLPNRFGLLNTEGTEANSDEENRDPNNGSSEEGDMIDVHLGYGVRLDFLDSEG